MRNFFLLLSVRLDELWGISEMRCEKDSLKKAGAYAHKLVMPALFAVCFLGFYTAADYTGRIGLGSVLPVTGYIFSIIITFLAVIIKLNGIFPGDEDSEFLLSVPLSGFTQVAVSFVIMYAGNLCITGMIEIPFLMAYIKYTSESVSLVRWLAGLLLTSLPICGIATLVGMVLILSLVNLPNKNRILTLISSLIMTAAAVTVLAVLDRIYLVPRDASLDSARVASAIIGELTKNLKFARFYQYGVVERRYGYMLLFGFMSAIWYLAFLFIHTISYQVVVTALRCPVSHGDKEPSEILGSMREHSETRAMLKKELEQFTGSGSYIRRAVLAAVLAVTVPANFFFVSPGPLEAYKAAIPALICFFTGLGSTSYCAMSMEGRKYWITQTAPASAKNLVRAKAAAAMIFSVPVSLVSGILFSIAFRTGITGWAANLIIPAAYSTAAAYYGLSIDRRFANYSSESEQIVLGRGITLLLGYLPTVLLPLIAGIAVIFLKNIL